MAGARNGKGEGKSGARGLPFSFPRAPDIPSPFPFLAPATQAKKTSTQKTYLHRNIAALREISQNCANFYTRTNVLEVQISWLPF